MNAPDPIDAATAIAEAARTRSNATFALVDLHRLITAARAQIETMNREALLLHACRISSAEIRLERALRQLRPGDPSAVQRAAADVIRKATAIVDEMMARERRLALGSEPPILDRDELAAIDADLAAEMLGGVE